MNRRARTSPFPSLLAAIAIILAAATPLPAAEPAPTDPPRKGSLRVSDLPTPIPELLQKIQQLSSKIEPEISRLGSTLGEELTVTVKKLCKELQCEEPSESR